ncbi:MAG: SMR family transporter [Staphylococcus sp.]|nr:SMR family transporter [Staphylococcus sp.]
MQWLKVILSGLIEVVWVTCLNYAHNTFTWLITLLFIALSFYLMLSATKQLPVGTVYAVFVGIGAAGTVIVDMLFINHVISLMKLLFIILLIIGIIGLKLSTDDQSEGGLENGVVIPFSCRML